MDKDSDGRVAPEDRSTNLPSYDDTVLIRMLDGDAQLASEILGEFLVALTRGAEVIGAAFVAGRGIELAESAHRLKSSARTVGAMQLGELCERLEDGAKRGSPDSVRRLISAVTTEIDVVAKQLRAREANTR
jgi:HPt (histidine-containing phosphotransfer) domain-containing protein